MRLQEDEVKGLQEDVMRSVGVTEEVAKDRRWKCMLLCGGPNGKSCQKGTRGAVRGEV